MPGSCSRCGKPDQLRGGQCPACYAYARRNGRPRPEATIVRHGRRLLEKELQRRHGR